LTLLNPVDNFPSRHRIFQPRHSCDLESRLVQRLEPTRSELAAHPEKLFYAPLDLKASASHFRAIAFTYRSEPRTIAVGCMTFIEVTELCARLKEPQIQLMLLAARLVWLPTVDVN
jgi:hypothetical protein